MRRLLVCLACVTALASFARSAEVTGYTLQVIAASDLRVEPRSSADRRTLGLRVRLLDDRGAPLVGRRVNLRARSVEGRGASERFVRPEVTDVLLTGEQGEVTYDLALEPSDRVMVVATEFAGEGTIAAVRREIRVDLDAPFVTTDLVLPTEGAELGGRALHVVVDVQVAPVVPFSAQGLPVEVLVDGRVVAAGVMNATGRVVLNVPVERVGAQGVHRAWSRATVREETVNGPQHDLLVRARTVLTLHRGVSAEREAANGATLTGALVAVPRGAIADASVRVVRGTKTLAGARTGRDGTFALRLGPELLAEPDVTVRAVFEPTEPWYLGTESDPVTLTPPAAPKVPWVWEVVPLGVAALVLAGVFARSWWRLRGLRAKAAPETEVVVDNAGERVEHVPSHAPGAGLRVRLVVSDRVTSREVHGARARWTNEAAWRATGDGPFSVAPARRIEFEVEADGYAPRKVTGEFSRPGEYVVTVQLRTWREELFEQARPWLRKALGRENALPTVREALAARSPTPNATAFVDLVERGCYGPEEPGAVEVREAGALAPVLDTPTIVSHETSVDVRN